MPSLADAWRSYLEQCRSDVEEFSEGYPDERSLYVDVIDLYEYDDEFLRAVLESPDRALGAAERVLRDLVDVSGPVHVRVENNPNRQSVAAVGARHVGDLVTVEGVVETVGDVEATATTAVYDCPACGATHTRSPSGIERDPPGRCEECGWGGSFDFRPSRSALVDLQRVVLGPEDDITGPRERLPAYLDDDIVGSVGVDARYSIAGIVRVRRREDANRFDPYLDGVAVREEHSASPPPDLDGVLDSHWRSSGNR